MVDRLVPESNNTRPDKHLGAQTDWRALMDLLEKGDYEHAAQILQNIQASNPDNNHPHIEALFAAARQICLACRQSQQEIAWHYAAHQDATARSDEYRRQLDSLVGKLSQYLQSPTPSAGLPLAMDGPGAAAQKFNDPEPRLSQSTWWQRIQKALGLLGNGQGTDGAQPDPPVPGAESSPNTPALPGGVLPAKKPSSLPSRRREVESADHTPPKKSPPANETASSEIPGKQDTAPADSLLKPGSASKPAHSSQIGPSLLVYCLGPFRVYQDEQPVESWSSSKGKAIFKYLITHRQRPVAKEILMDLFWPDSDPDAARNNLNVAIYSLRQTLRSTYPSFSHILYQEESYRFNPQLKIWLDCDLFTECISNARALEEGGEFQQAAQEYEAAEALYQGEFLEEDRYEDWLIPIRESYQNDYLYALECLSRFALADQDYSVCITVCQKMLRVDPCREEAHRRLMHCYQNHGQPYLALRQYHACSEALKAELGVSPTRSTTDLYLSIVKQTSI